MSSYLELGKKYQMAYNMAMANIVVGSYKTYEELWSELVVSNRFPTIKSRKVIERLAKYNKLNKC